MKLAISLLLYLSFSYCFAEDIPHIVPAQECPANQICCPKEIYCSGELNSCGNVSSWILTVLDLTLKETLKYKLISETGTRGRDPAKIDPWNMDCVYGRRGGASQGMIILETQPNMISDLKGKWQYYESYGHKNNYALCESSNPLSCTAEKAQ